MAKYGLISDIHFHDWSAFSKKDSNGLNTRLVTTIEAFKEAIAVMVAHGVRTVFVTGDIFHVRGSVKPTVFNPVKRMFEDLVSFYDINFILMPGNHDLEDEEVTPYGCSFDSLNGDKIIVNKYPSILVEPYVEFAIIPWIKDRDKLIAEIESMAKRVKNVGASVLLLHAPLNDTIPGLPNHGIDPSDLAGFGFGAVFSGHYHNHVVHPGNVVSVGALTHQTWSDVGTKAGFLLYDTGSGVIEHFPTRAPEFIKFDAKLPMNQVVGKYVMVETSKAMSEAQIEKVKEGLQAAGAEAVVVRGAKRTSATSRSTAVVSPTQSLQSVVVDYARDKYGEDAELEAVLDTIIKDAEAKHD